MPRECARDYRITSNEKIVPNFKGSQSRDSNRNNIKMKNYTNRSLSPLSVWDTHPVTMHRIVFLVKVEKLSWCDKTGASVGQRANATVGGWTLSTFLYPNPLTWPKPVALGYVVSDRIHWVSRVGEGKGSCFRNPLQNSEGRWQNCQEKKLLTVVNQ